MTAKSKHTTRVLKRPRRQHTIQKQRLRARILLQPRLVTILERPERRNDDNLRPIRNQFPKRLWKR